MNKKENLNFIQKTESLVKPQDITAISFLGDFNKLLPPKTQNKIMEKGSKKIPYMGFIVDPYCLFLAYEITDVAAAETMLPEGYELADTTFFEGGKKTPMVIISAFSARTSAFIGARLEFYIIAREKKTGLLSWIISDYETNTNSHDPKNGFCGYTADPAFLSVTPYGEIIADFRNKQSDKHFSVSADFNKGRMRPLDEELWVEGNLSVDYGGELLNDTSKPFSLIFDPVTMKEAVEIDISDINVVANTFMNNIIDYKNPVSAAVFPYSQHFIIKQDLDREELKGPGDLEGLLSSFISRDGFKTMAGDDIKRPLIRGFIISSILNMGIILFLLLKLLL